MGRRAMISVLLISVALYSAVCFLSLPVFLPSGGTVSEESHPIVILDAGHGGEDSGTVGINGVLEKDLNLAVSQNLAALLRSAGITVIETRTEDRLLYTEAENIKGYRKLYDLKNRLAVATAHPDAIFISLHMNSFPEERYKGLQIYYSQNNEESRILAARLQKEVKAALQPDNDRKIKPASSTIYLLDRAENPALLIECGFLSNPEESTALSEEDYRKELSFVLFCGIINHISENKTKE